MRYRDYYKDRATSGGLSLGGDYGNSFTTQSGTAVQGSGGAGMGYGQGTADPIYIVMICEIVEAPLAAKAQVVVPPPPPPPPPAPVAPPPPPPVVIEKPMVSALPVFFDYNKYNIRPDAEDILQKNLQWFKENPGKKMRIEAYCDIRGTTAYNKGLAQRRANTVKQWFIRHGVKSGILIAAIGKTELFGHDGKDEKIYQMNRRVQFVPVQ
jgi:peptidoglycan-associated lipoprotein